MQDKSAIRREMRAKRKALTPEEKARASSVVCTKLQSGRVLEFLGDLWTEDTGTIAVYLASPDELDLTAFIEELLARKISVVAPRWNGETYELARLKSLRSDDLRKGPMGILEPTEPEIVEPKDVSAWIVPGLAFTRDGRRLGYGGGWYDRLMVHADKQAKLIGVAHAFQVVDDLPSEPHDIRLTDVVDDNLDDPQLQFEETEEGFRARVESARLNRQRGEFLFGVGASAMLIPLLSLAAGRSSATLSNAMFFGVLFPLSVLVLVGVFALVSALRAAEVVEVELCGATGVCRRRFLGWWALRTRRFPWNTWTKAWVGESEYDGTGNLVVEEGSEGHLLCSGPLSALDALSIRMNLRRCTGSAALSSLS